MSAPHWQDTEDGWTAERIAEMFGLRPGAAIVAYAEWCYDETYWPRGGVR